MLAKAIWLFTVLQQWCQVLTLSGAGRPCCMQHMLSGSHFLNSWTLPYKNTVQSKSRSHSFLLHWWPLPGNFLVDCLLFGRHQNLSGCVVPGGPQHRLPLNTGEAGHEATSQYKSGLNYLTTLTSHDHYHHHWCTQHQVRLLSATHHLHHTNSSLSLCCTSL